VSRHPNVPTADREERRCVLCQYVKRLENLVRCGYESDDGRSAGSARVCLRCMGDLPSEVLVNGSPWTLIFRAP
jgi:hypothetical protein